MRRTLTRATAACATYALVVSLGVGAPVAADEKAPIVKGGAPESGLIGASPVGGGPFGGVGVHSEEDPSAIAHDDGGRMASVSSLWTHVDRAFPDQPSNMAENGSLGTGRLAWDRVYTRRALFRFPVELGSESVVESAVLRVDVAWSYDCESDSVVELHRVDPFDENTTWNDQPASRGLLDTRNVRGGHTACPLHGGVEFDVTEAYQRALDDGEHHLHLRLGAADESGSTAWRRFDVEDHPPALVVDHGPAPTGYVAPSERAAPWDGLVPPDDDPPNPVPPPVVPVTMGIGDALLRGHDGPSSSDPVRSPRAERTDHAIASDGHRWAGETTRARGPPSAAPLKDRTRGGATGGIGR